MNCRSRTQRILTYISAFQGTTPQLPFSATADGPLCLPISTLTHPCSPPLQVSCLIPPHPFRLACACIPIPSPSPNRIHNVSTYISTYAMEGNRGVKLVLYVERKLQLEHVNHSFPNFRLFNPSWLGDLQQCLHS